MLRFNFLPKFSIIIGLTFILFTVIGTLSHEYGHIVVAKYFGYDTTLSYGSMNYFPEGYLNDVEVEEINTLIEDYKPENYENWPNDLKQKVEAKSNKLRHKYPQNETHSFWIGVGGPAQTMLTSFIGLLILFFRRKKRKHQFKIIDWFAVFMSLFALREVFNFIDALFVLISNPEANFYSDEFGISTGLGCNEWVIPILSFILGMLISCYVIFKIIPLKYRFSFIIAGFVGGIVGFATWFGFLGPALFN